MTGSSTGGEDRDPMHLADDTLMLHYYRELDVAARGAAVRHLASCPECRERLAQLEHVLATVDDLPEADPPSGLADRVWAQLLPVVSDARMKPPRVVSWPRWAVAGLAATLVAAFLAGWLVRGRSGGEAPVPVMAEAPAVRERVVLIAVGEHLDRSQTVLVELLNAPEDARHVLAAERERASDLVAANRLYRQTAMQAGDEALSEVLDDLERVLVEIANSSPESTVREIERMRARIEAHGILFRVRVMSSDVRAREAAPRRDSSPDSDSGPEL